MLLALLINELELQNKYKVKVAEKLETNNNRKDTQSKWNKVVSSCIEAAEETTGLKNKSKQIDHKDLTERQKK